MGGDDYCGACGSTQKTCARCVEGLRRDAERYRWLRDTLAAAKAGGGVEVNEARQYYDKPNPGEEVRLYWYNETPVGCWSVMGATLDEVIDSARSSARIANWETTSDDAW